jgi:hypothetical protein
MSLPAEWVVLIVKKFMLVSWRLAVGILKRTKSGPQFKLILDPAAILMAR